jgi:methanogenic corrinoid protein MtbC1
MSGDPTSFGLRICSKAKSTAEGSRRIKPDAEVAGGSTRIRPEQFDMRVDDPDTKSQKIFPIGFVSLATGLSPHVIRVWEKRYQAVAPQRMEKKRRLYSQEDIDRLKLLQRARLRGLRIGSVVTLDEEALHRMGHNDGIDFGRSEPQVEFDLPFEGPYELLQACERAVWKLDASALSLALKRGDTRLTRISMLTDVVAPLMHLVGEGWSAKRLGIMHEHFASSIVKGFLLDILLRATADEHAPRMVVATPAGQHCEIGALAAGIAAADSGWRVVYFGPDLPSEEIAAAAASQQAEAVCLSITCRSRRDAVSRELNRLRQQLGEEVRVLIGGQAAAAWRQTVTASNFYFLTSVNEFSGFRTRPWPTSETP